MVMMKTLNPIHNQFEPLTASMKKNKIAFGLGGSNPGAGAESRSRSSRLLLRSAPAPVVAGCSYQTVSLTIRSF